MKKRYLLAPVLVTGIVVGGMTLTKSNAYLDLDGLNQQVQRHDEQLDNHEVRIKNNENDIKDVQDKTETPPNTNNTSAPEVLTAPATQVERPTTNENASPSEPQPTENEEPDVATVVSYRQIPIEGTEDIDCEYIYSDSTTRRFRWRTVTYNQGSRIVRTTGTCDDTIIGSKKPE